PRTARAGGADRHRLRAAGRRRAAAHPAHRAADRGPAPGRRRPRALGARRGLAAAPPRRRGAADDVGFRRGPRRAAAVPEAAAPRPPARAALGDPLFGELLGSSDAEAAWHRQWSGELIRLALAQRPENERAIAEWRGRWQPRADAAMTALEGTP